MKYFTPGPWFIKTSRSLAVYDKNQNCICSTGSCTNIDFETHQANARLIANAPELLAALEQIAAMTYVTEFKGKKVEIDRGLIFNVAARAVAQAKGET